MTVSLFVELLLSLLLAATLVYCAILERRLSALRKGQDGFRETIAELNASITTAGASMRLLRSAAAETSEALDLRLSDARRSIDELQLLSASAERIADRIERGATASQQRVSPPARMPGALHNRVDALKPRLEPLAGKLR